MFIPRFFSVLVVRCSQLLVLWSECSHIYTEWIAAILLLLHLRHIQEGGITDSLLLQESVITSTPLNLCVNFLLSTI